MIETGRNFAVAWNFCWLNLGKYFSPSTVWRANLIHWWNGKSVLFHVDQCSCIYLRTLPFSSILTLLPKKISCCSVRYVRAPLRESRDAFRPVPGWPKIPCAWALSSRDPGTKVISPETKWVYALSVNDNTLLHSQYTSLGIGHNIRKTFYRSSKESLDSPWALTVISWCNRDHHYMKFFAVFYPEMTFYHPGKNSSRDETM